MFDADADVFVYTFRKGVKVAQAEATLIVAMLAVESLHGPSAVRMDGRFEFLPQKRKCRILADSPLGQDLNRIYTGLLTREFGGSAFTVERAGRRQQEPAPKSVGQ